jgi:hypothetical protein
MILTKPKTLGNYKMEIVLVDRVKKVGLASVTRLLSKVQKEFGNFYRVSGNQKEIVPSSNY